MMAELDVIEMQMIRKYQPKYNIKGTDKEKEKRVAKEIIPEDIQALLKSITVELPPSRDVPTRTYMVRRL
jgi:hypothetical protein